MNCRRLTVPEVAAAAVLSLAAAAMPASARADALSTFPYYVLTTDKNIAPADKSSSGPQVIASIQPPGALLAPSTTDRFSTQQDGTLIGPIFIPNQAFLASDGQSYATGTSIDRNHLVVAEKNLPSVNGGPVKDLFGLAFFGKGMSKDDKLVFQLNAADPNNPPNLVSETAGVTITPLKAPALPAPPPPKQPDPVKAPQTTTTAVTSAPTPPAPNTPEPVSLALWSALTGAGLLRARALRRRRAA